MLRRFRLSLASRALPPVLVGLAAFVTLTGQSAPPEAVTRVATLVDDTSDRVLWGVYIADAATGRVIYESSGMRPMLPASNTKVLTAAVALDALGSDFVYSTPLLFTGTRDGATLRGDLVVRGSGDPSFGSLMMDSVNVRDPFQAWADSLRAQGVTRIEGRLVGNDNAQSDQPYGDGWDIDYVGEQGSRVIGVASSGLPYRDDVVTVRFGQTAKNGTLDAEPAGYLRIDNRIGESEATRGSAIRLERSLGQEQVVVRGRVNASRGATVHVPVYNPTAFAVASFRARLAAAGIDVSKLVASDIDALDGDANEAVRSADYDTLFVHRSPPLRALLREVGQQSNNFYAEQIFRTFGWEGTPEGAAGRVKSFLSSAGADAARVALSDGSGLSRKNYVTPEALAKTVAAMLRHREREVFLDQLARPGLRSTLGYRLDGVDVRAKTGALEFVRGLTGVVTTAGGQEVVFSILANNVTGSAIPALVAMDDIVRAVGASTVPL